MGKLVPKSIRCDCRRGGKDAGKAACAPLRHSLFSRNEWSGEDDQSCLGEDTLRPSEYESATDDGCTHIPLIVTFAETEGVRYSAYFQVTMSPSLLADTCRTWWQPSCERETVMSKGTANQRLWSVSPAEKLIDGSTCASASCHLCVIQSLTLSVEAIVGQQCSNVPLASATCPTQDVLHWGALGLPWTLELM